MDYTLEEFKHCDLLSVSGRIDSQTAPELAEALDDILDQGRYNIVLDLNDVLFISSAGLRVLINTQKQCKRLNRGEVVLARVPERIYEAMDLAGFIPLFEIFDDKVHAVGYF
ncbi:MAG: anti-sigma factor antagonist [Chloroflexi bacterium]|jgi:anti-sigma B factor antagonist|nr:anti-sigma factor antagonist [Chloroflexota bacterium]